MTSDENETTQVLSLTILKNWQSKIAQRFDSQLAAAAIAYLEENYFTDGEEDGGFGNIAGDFEEEDCENSDIIQSLRVEQPHLKLNDVKCQQLFNFMKAECMADESAEACGPNDILWADPSAAEEQRARAFMQIQTPGAIKSAQNANLIRMIAIGTRNFVPIITLLMDMYALHRAQKIVENENPPRVNTYIDRSPYFSAHPRKAFFVNALRDYEHRLAGVGLQRIIQPQIHDNLNEYVMYVLALTNVIRNLTQTNAACMPLQFDLLIIGQDFDENDHSHKHKNQNQNQNQNQNNNNGNGGQLSKQSTNNSNYGNGYGNGNGSGNDNESADDDELNMAALINDASMSMASFVNQKKETLRSENIGELLTQMSIPFEHLTMDIRREFRQQSSTQSNASQRLNLALIRKFQEPIAKVLGDQRSTRICILIDRTKKASMTAEAMLASSSSLNSEQPRMDEIFVYQIESKYNALPLECNDETLSFKSKYFLIPDFYHKWKMENVAKHKHPYIGAGLDIGLRSFVFSWHLLQSNQIKCYQYLKSQKSVFTLYHILHLWPLFFGKGFNKINEEFTIESLKRDFTLPLNMKTTMKWLSICDPKLYKKIQQYNHND